MLPKRYVKFPAGNFPSIVFGRMVTSEQEPALVTLYPHVAFFRCRNCDFVLTVTPPAEVCCFYCDVEGRGADGIVGSFMLMALSRCKRNTLYIILHCVW
jgi:hypothetical protein